MLALASYRDCTHMTSYYTPFFTCDLLFALKLVKELIASLAISAVRSVHENKSF